MIARSGLGHDEKTSVLAYIFRNASDSCQKRAVLVLMLSAKPLNRCALDGTSASRRRHTVRSLPAEFDERGHVQKRSERHANHGECGDQFVRRVNRVHLSGDGDVTKPVVMATARSSRLIMFHLRRCGWPIPTLRSR